jgi:hypothetical protein
VLLEVGFGSVAIVVFGKFDDFIDSGMARAISQ